MFFLNWIDMGKRALTSALFFAPDFCGTGQRSGGRSSRLAGLGMMCLFVLFVLFVFVCPGCASWGTRYAVPLAPLSRQCRGFPAFSASFLTV